MAAEATERKPRLIVAEFRFDPIASSGPASTRTEAYPHSAQGRCPPAAGSRPLTAVNSLSVQVPVGLSLGGCDLLVERVGVGLLVFDSVEVLAVDVGECCAVAGVAEEQVEHGPDE